MASLLGGPGSIDLRVKWDLGLGTDYAGTVRLLRKLLRRHLNFTVPARIASKRYRIPVWGGMETPGVTDTWQVGLYRELASLRPGAFVDVGVNLGQTLLQVRAGDEIRPYVGFEPNPACVGYVETLVRRNALAGVTIVPSGLSDSARLLLLYFPPGDAAHSAATVVRNMRPQSDTYVSRVISAHVFDEVATSVGARPASFVKIDVEGHELEVLSGMVRTLEEDRPLLLVEVLPQVGASSAGEREPRKERFHSLLASRRYVLRRVLPGPVATDPVRLERPADLLDPPFRADESYDYLLVPEELADRVDQLFAPT